MEQYGKAEGISYHFGNLQLMKLSMVFTMLNPINHPIHKPFKVPCQTIPKKAIPKHFHRPLLGTRSRALGESHMFFSWLIPVQLKTSNKNFNQQRSVPICFI